MRRREEDGLYNERYSFLTWQNEVEVMLSLMGDKALMEMKDTIEVMIREEAYKSEGFPLSLGGLRWVQTTIMFAFWVRKGKGVKIEKGEIVVCALKESPFCHRYQASYLLQDDCEQDTPQIREEERGEWV